MKKLFCDIGFTHRQEPQIGTGMCASIVKSLQELLRRNRLRSCSVFVVAVLLSSAIHSYAGDEKEAKSGEQVGKLDPTAAIERARQGDPEELIRMTMAMASQPKVMPSDKSLSQYHKYLQDTNVFVQSFAVMVLAKIKDKESAEPLRQFIMDTERRRRDLETSDKKNPDPQERKAAFALVMANQAALMALGDIDEGSPISVKFLASQLKHDLQMEWGGGVVHSALAKKGRAGLRALLDEATQPLESRQEGFLRSAINKIDDPELAVDLYACCKDAKYNKTIRQAALWSLGEMAKRSSDIEQMLISLAEDDKADLRSMAIERLGCTGSPRAYTKLIEYEKTIPTEARAVENALLHCDPSNRVPLAIEKILSPKTPLAEKEWLWDRFEGAVNEELQPYEEQLRKCLAVCDANGAPINVLRGRVWRRLFRLTQKRYPIELDANDVHGFGRVSSEMTETLKRPLNQRFDGKAMYTESQLQQMASEEAQTLIKKWDGQVTKEAKQ